VLLIVWCVCGMLFSSDGLSWLGWNFLGEVLVRVVVYEDRYRFGLWNI